MLEKKIVYVKEQIIFLCFSFETLAFAQMKKDKLSTFDSVLCLLQHFNLEDSCPKKIFIYSLLLKQILLLDNQKF